MQQQQQQFLPDGDLAYTVLADLKRVTREYATAATESSCPVVRQQFTQLLNTSLAMQGELFTAMSQQQMYNTASPVIRQEIDKQMKQYQQTQQKTNQFVQQRKSTANPPSPQSYGGWAYQPAPQWQQQNNPQQPHSYM
ncbi:spore coat protein [Cohnella lubricantis]|uniref:Spore coat protein n=1 Tax=Cohnella lubricantis TaxID=2163172 RepID=A0A841TGF7_9BACL|nr:spore coat protein [Cohnella lubricantis]MBB6678348.1 spore coat protein [Cohnella lubricantis]MBP2116728.1 spore coat protein CotF [Cohnella lubricantis]